MFRSHFEIPEDIAYFNTAGNAPQLRAVTAALTEAAAAKAHPWKRPPRDFFEDADAVSALCQELFGGANEGWAVVPAASTGMSLAARTLEPQLGPGRDVLVLAEAFPSEVLPWQRAASERGAQIRMVPLPAEGRWTEAVLRHLDPGVAVAVLPPCHWTSGAALDLLRVSAACRAQGTALAVDATQALGAMPLDLETIQPDFLVASGYKWLLCPYGVSVLYVAPQHREARPLEETWLARQGAEDFAGLVNYSPTYRSGARRFDGGQTCSALLPGARVALTQLRTWGIPWVSDALARITGPLASRLQDLGLEIPPETVPHFFGVTLPEGVPGPALVQALAAEGIYVGLRGRAMRLSPHLHVETRDIHRLCDALERHLRRTQA